MNMVQPASYPNNILKKTKIAFHASKINLFNVIQKKKKKWGSRGGSPQNRQIELALNKEYTCAICYSNKTYVVQSLTSRLGENTHRAAMFDIPIVVPIWIRVPNYLLSSQDSIWTLSYEKFLYFGLFHSLLMSLGISICACHAF